MTKFSTYTNKHTAMHAYIYIFVYIYIYIYIYIYKASVARYEHFMADH